MTRMISGKTIALVLMTALVLGAATAADAQQRGSMMDRRQTQNYDDQWWGHGPGMMRGQGMMGQGMMGPGMGMMGGQGMSCPIMNQMGYGMGMAVPLDIPNLTQKQQREINAIQREMRRENIKRMADIMDIRDDLMDELATERPNPEKVRKMQASISEKQEEMMETSVKNRNRIYDLLDEQQKKMIQEYRRRPAERP